MSRCVENEGHLQIIDQVIESLKGTIEKFKLLEPISHPTLHNERMKKLKRVLEELQIRREWVQ